MALLPHTVADIRENFELHLPHSKLKPEQVVEIGKKEYLLLKRSSFRKEPYGVPLRRSRGSTYAYRFYYRGKMFDIRADFLRYLRRLTPKPSIPRIPRGVNPLSITRHHDGFDITCLERCLVGGKNLRASEIKSVGQAFYVFGCMAEGTEIDDSVFKNLEGSGHLNDVLSESKDSQGVNIKKSTTANPSEGADNQKSTTQVVKFPNIKPSGKAFIIPFPEGVVSQNSSTENVRPCHQSSTETPLDILKEIRDKVSGIESKLGLLDERVATLECKSQPSGVAETHLLKVEDVTEEVLRQVVGNLVDRFETGIRLNKDGETFLLKMIDRIDELINSGMRKSASFRKVYEEMNIKGSEFHRLQVAFSNCKLGINKGKPVSVYDIERYWRKDYYVAECLNPNTGVVERRVLKNYDS